MKTIQIGQGSIIRLHSVPGIDWEVTWVGTRFLVLAREIEKDLWMISLIDAEGEGGAVRYEFIASYFPDKKHVVLLGKMLADYGVGEQMLNLGCHEELPADICCVDGVDFFEELSPDTKISVLDHSRLYEMN